MEIQIQKDKIFPLIVQAQGILDKRNLLPIFSNLLLKSMNGNLNIYASDSELSFLGTIPVTLKKEGSLVVNGKQFFDILREFSDSSFSLIGTSDHRLNIKQGKGVFHLRGLNPEDYPVFPEIKTKQFQKIEASKLVDIIDKTVYCVSLDENRYHLTGVFCEFIDSHYRFVATDGHRMSFIDVPVADFLSSEDSKKKNSSFVTEGVIIPRKGLQELRKMISSEEDGFVEWSIEKPRLIAKFNSQILSIRLIEGTYPDYKQLIPKKEGHEITLDRENFLRALKRVSVLTSARFRGVNFLFSKNKLSIESNNPDVGEAKEEIECVNNKEIKIRFNAKYILDIAHSLRDEKIKFVLQNDISPGLIKGDKTDSYICVVMPMKL